MNIFPDISWDFTDYGVRSFQDRRLPDSSLLHRVTEIVVSNIRVVADPRVDSFAKTDNAAWTLPIDDRRRASSPCSAWVPKATGVADDDQRCADLRREVVVRARRCGHQRHPGDFEAEVGQGVVTLHSEEHLAASDRGVVMFRTLYTRAIKAVARGEDSPCAWRRDADALIRLQAGNSARAEPCPHDRDDIVDSGRRCRPDRLESVVVRGLSNMSGELKIIANEIDELNAERLERMGVSEIEQATFDYLASLEWIAAAENLCLVGPAGTGKSHLLVALGHAAVAQGMRVRYFAAADLVETLYRGLADNSVAKIIDTLPRADLVIIDELGFAPLDLAGTQLLFRFVAAAYERRSLGIASHWPFAQGHCSGGQTWTCGCTWGDSRWRSVGYSARDDRADRESAMTAESDGGDWRLRGVRVVRADELDVNTPQTPGMNRAAAINAARAGAEKLWAGTVIIHPAAETGAHHHGPLESVIYVVSGRARMRWGERLEYMAEAGPGDFIYVPPFVPHQEINARPDAPLSCVVVRSGQEPVVVNLDLPAIEPKPEHVHWVDDIHRAP